MATHRDRQNRACLPVVRSREDSDTFSSVGHFISFLFYLVTPDNKI